MAVALFIKREDLVRNSIIDGNVDFDKFIFFIKEAQEMHIHQYLGTDLYNKISADIVASSLSGDYLTLVNSYIQPMLIHYAMVEYLPFAAFQIKNGGIFKHQSENSVAATKEEVDFLVQNERNKAEQYTRRFIDYMTFNLDKFPEYLTNTNEDTHPSKDATYNGWVL